MERGHVCACVLQLWRLRRYSGVFNESVRVEKVHQDTAAG